MNVFLKHSRETLQHAYHAFRRILHKFIFLLQEQLNKNIYTKILFTNVMIYFVVLISLALLTNFMVKQATFYQAEQDLTRKAKRVNFALTQEKDLSWKTQEQSNTKQNLLIFLADSFDVRITVFDRRGAILSTSEEQEIVPGSKINENFIKLLASGETNVNRATDKETGQLTFSTVIPMGNTEDTMDTVENGILLEAQPSDLNHILNKILFSLLVGGTAILVIIIFISVYLAMCISKPISRLTTYVTESSRGSFVPNKNDKSLDEIDVLSEQIDKLMVKLKNVETESRKIEEERVQLFAEISHELRTPLTAVQGFTEAIRDGMVEDEKLQKKYLDMIYTQTLHISRLVDDILALSRLESGVVTVEKLPLDLAVLAHGVVMSMEGMSQIKNNRLMFEKDTENAIVLGDVDRMEQILRNLLKNANMATENGIIKVGVRSDQSEVILTIEDNGIGIEPEDLPHIWDRFYRAANQRSTNIDEKGSGLGLVIVNKLVQLQDGKIEAESQRGKGTVFRISFPISQ